MFKHSICLLALIGIVATTGCSTDENPITPEKMQDIRKKQSEEMANQAKTGGAPPASPQASSPQGSSRSAGK